VGKRAESRYSSGQLRPVSMNKMVKGLARRCLSEADAERFKFKSLRDAFHDAANRALSVRGENRIVNGLMGQSSGSNAGDRYAISEETMREAYEAVFTLITINDRRREKEEYESLKERLVNQEELIKALTTHSNTLQLQVDGLTRGYEMREEIRKIIELRDKGTLGP